VTVVIIDTNPLSKDISISANDCIPYAILAFVSMFYPLSGFIADVRCGRLKSVTIGLCLIFTFKLLLCLVEISMLIKSYSIITFHEYSIFFTVHFAEGIIACFIIALIVFIIGLAGYQANIIQLGLDQLFEAPSQYLSLFILYVIWAFKLGSLPLIFSLPSFFCGGSIRLFAIGMLIFLPFVILVSMIALLIISWWKRHWFTLDVGRKNPYKIVFRVINFARKHRYPLQRSAFTYCDNYIPSRLDFAKERYGGPFTTEQVENVKTFLRILIILLSIGPIFNLEVTGSYFVFPVFGFHALHHIPHVHIREFCTGPHTVLGTGALMGIASTLVLFPVYICITFIILRKRVQSIFIRLSIGAILCLLGVASMLIIDITGHSLKQVNVSNHSETQCMFQLYMVNGTFQFHELNMHWSVLIPPSLFLGVGPLIVMTATLEFIAAQSPQSMKGFLIGVFFAIRGLFQFLNSIITVPFSLKRPWASGEMLENPPVTNCGFVYLLFTCVVGLIGLILFSVAAKKYRYRRRDEGMFRQMDIEDIFEREIEQTSVNRD
jgi:peptide/histidine transporter 3/4